LLRFPFEKTKGQFDDHWPFLFNPVIECLDLREVTMIERQFTWANNLPEPTYKKLDRMLMNSDWEYKFPMASVCLLERIEALSDHHSVLAGSSLNLDGYTRKVSMIWSWRFGNALLMVGPQWKDGIQKYEQFVNTWVVGQDTQHEFLRINIMTFGYH
jgi:hypothetical protein